MNNKYLFVINNLSLLYHIINNSSLTDYSRQPFLSLSLKIDIVGSIWKKGRWNFNVRAVLSEFIQNFANDRIFRQNDTHANPAKTNNLLRGGRWHNYFHG